MPVERCQKEGREGWRFGESGVCFIGPDAKERAEEVGRAIAARRQDLANHVAAWAWYADQRAVRHRPTHTCAPVGSPTLLRELHGIGPDVRRRDARRRLPQQAEPRTFEKRYQRQLQRRVRETNAHLEAAIQQALKRLPGIDERARRDSPATDAAALIQVVNQVERAVRSGNPIDVAALTRLGGQVENFTTRAVTTQLVATVPGIEVTTTLGVTADLLEAWVADNVELITSLDAKYFDQVRDVIRESVEKGRSTANISKLLQQRANVAKSRADLIARDQVGTLNAKVTEARQTSLGIEEYTWSNSGDNKVRPAHQDAPVGLGETVRRWDTPHPTEGHPGEPINCRCSAIPVI